MASFPFSPEQLALELEWFEARDRLLNDNGQKQDVKRALELAAACQHPEARWLTRVFAGKNVTTNEEAKDVFLSQGNNDGLALCFASMLGPKNEGGIALMQRAAELGSPLAELVCSWHGDSNKRFAIALKCSLHGEREGFLALAFCYKEGTGCEQDFERAKESFICAAKLNSTEGMCYGGLLFDEADPQRWYWLGCAAKGGRSNEFLKSFVEQVKAFDNDPSFRPAVFAIGRALKGHIDIGSSKIFDQWFDFADRIGPANRAVEFFTAQCVATRAAIDTWCLIARLLFSNQINQDIRKKIGMLIWEARELAQY